MGERMTEARYQSNRVTLYLGDCLEVLPTLAAGSVDALPRWAFFSHVARLAKANEIVGMVRFGVGNKHPEWPYVVNGDGCSEKLATVLTRTLVTLYGDVSGRQPASPPIGGRATNPKWAVLSAHPGLSAFFRAVQRFAVLSDQPGLGPKLLPASAAGKDQSLTPSGIVGSADLFWHECIRGALPLSEVIADQMPMGHRPVLHMPLPPTGEGAETRPVFSVGLHLKRLVAYFARLRNHARSIPQWMGLRNGGVAYFEIAKKRIRAAESQLRLPMDT